MNQENAIKTFLTGEHHNTLFVTLDDDSCYFVPTTSDMNPSIVDTLIDGNSRFSVYLFNSSGAPYLFDNYAHTRIMRTVYDGPVITETWDDRNYEWIPA